MSRTILLVDVRDAETGTPLADHLWLTAGKWTIMLREGSVIEFTAVGRHHKLTRAHCLSDFVTG